jgi:hypothetical protein
MAVALVLLIALLLRTLGRGDEGVPGNPSTTPTVDDTDRRGDGENSTAVESADAQANGELARQEVVSNPPEPTATTGTLLVNATWKSEGEAAKEIPIFVRPRGAGRRPKVAWQQHTDDQGKARFVELPAGGVVVSANRGADRTKLVTIEAGKEVELQLELAEGVTVTGTVVDPSKAPVAGADIVVAGWASGGAATLAQTDKDGRFELRGVGANSSVGARAAGFAPSLLQGLTGKKGGAMEVHIVLPGLGGGLTCTVLNPDGEPVQQAIVRAGIEGRQYQPQQMADGSWGALIPLQQRADEHGRVSFLGVAVGDAPVAAWIDGFSPWQGSASIGAGRTTDLTIRLQPQASLIGTVRDAENNPHPEVYVILGRHGTLAGASTQTDADGNYRFDGIPIGEFRAEMQGNGIRVLTKLTSVPGQTLRWDPALPAARNLPGRLLGPNGAGVAKASVSGSGGGGWLNARTDEQGRFTLENVRQDKELRLKVEVGGSLFPTEVYRSLPPATGELTLHLRADQMPSVRFIGKLVDPDGDPFTNASLSPQMRGHGNTYGFKTEEDGSFDYGPYPPGEYRLLVRAKGWAKVQTPWRQLQPGEVVDFGNIQLEPPGSLVVHLTGLAMPKKASFTVYNASGGYCSRIPIAGGKGQVGGLGSGDYQLQIRGKGVAAAIMPFAIRSGGETRLDVPAKTGAPVTFSVVWPGRPATERLNLVVLDATGNRVIRSNGAYFGKGGLLSGDYDLTPGRYRATVSTREHRGEIEFAVTASGASVAIPVK